MLVVPVPSPASLNEVVRAPVLVLTLLFANRKCGLSASAGRACRATALGICVRHGDWNQKMPVFPAGLPMSFVTLQSRQTVRRFLPPDGKARGKNCRIDNDVRRCADRGCMDVHVHGEADMARIVIITGAASGIGRELARALVLRGDTVVGADIDGDGAEPVAGGGGPRAAG